jgi:hypothetical protein
MKTEYCRSGDHLRTKSFRTFFYKNSSKDRMRFCLFGFTAHQHSLSLMSPKQVLSCHLYHFRPDNKVPYIFTDLQHLITWYACLPDYLSRINIKTVVKSSVCRITNFGNVHKTFCLFILFHSIIL